VSFDWVPSGPEASSAVVGRRGEDLRLDISERMPAHERLAMKKARRRRPEDDQVVSLHDDEAAVAADAGAET